jgi:hypothetical protein
MEGLVIVTEVIKSKVNIAVANIEISFGDVFALFFRFFLSIKFSSLLIMSFFVTVGLYYSFLTTNDTNISIRTFYSNYRTTGLVIPEL